MRAADRQPYLFANKYDPETKTRTNCVGIKCKKCPAEEWHSAPGPGWGRRIFKNRGWVCGNSPRSHICPKCAEMKATGVVKGTPAPAPKTAEIVQLKQPTPTNIAPNAPPPPAALPPASADAGSPFAEALAPLKQKIEREQTIKKARGQPTGYASRTSAAAAARKMLNTLGNKKPMEGEHYRVVPEAAGTFGYVLIGVTPPARPVKPPKPVRVPKVRTPAPLRSSGVRKALYDALDAAGPFPAEQRDMEIPARGHRPPNRPGDKVKTMLIARNSADVVARRFGIEKPEEGVHFRVHRQDDGYTYSLIEEAVPFKKAPPTPVIPPTAWEPPPAPPEPAPQPHVPSLRKWHGGYLSRFDARKAAIAAVAPVKITPGAPSEGIDYWISQDAHNYWIWTTTPPAAEPAPQPEAQAPEPQPKEPEMGANMISDEPPPAPAPGREWTREERSKVREAVEEHYDDQRECWHGDLSDARVAEMLKVPRIFVTNVRSIYGPDRNRSEDLKREAELLAKRQKIDEAVELAERALNLSNIVIETAAKLETVLAELKAKKQEVGL
jgi:hypothetical protein